MKYLGFFMKNAPDAMSAILPHDRIIMGFGVLLNNVPDIAECNAGLDDVDCLIQTFLRDFDEAFCMLGYFADAEHFAGVAMETIFYDGDIDIYGVTCLEGLTIAGNAVTNNVVYRGADRFRKAIIIQWSWDGLLYIDDIVVADLIQLACANSRLHVWTYHFQDFGCQLARYPHLTMSSAVLILIVIEVPFISTVVKDKTDSSKWLVL